MIHVTDKYLIGVDDLNYTVHINRPQTKKGRNGKDSTFYPVVGYCGSLENALLLIRERLIRDGLKNAESTLFQAISEVKRITTEFEEVVKGVTE